MNAMPLFTFGIVVRNELEFQQTFQNFLDAFGSRIFIEPSQHLPMNPGNVASLPKPKSALKYNLQPERHIAKEQLSTAQRILEVITRAPTTFTMNHGIQVSDRLYFADGSLTETPPVRTMPNNNCLLMYTKGFGRRRSLSLVCEAINSGVLDAGRQCSYFHQFKLLSAPNTVLIISKNDDIAKWENEVENCFVIADLADFDLLTFDLISNGTTIILAESALPFISNIEESTYETVQEIFARESSGVRHSRQQLDAQKIRRFYIGSVGQRHTHAVIPLTFIHYRCIIIDQGLETAALNHAFSTEFTIYNDGYKSLVPLYPKGAYFLPSTPHAQRILNDPNSGMLVKSAIPETMIRKICFLPIAVQLTAQEKKFILRMQRIAATKSMINRHLDISNILLGGEYNDISACSFEVALQRLSPMTKESATANLKKHFSLINGTLGQRLLSDFGVLEEEFASRSYVQENLKQNLPCNVCFESNTQVLTLCGHHLCAECKEMLATEDQLLFKCPKCRSSLTHYDFLEVGEVDILPQSCTKFLQIVQTLNILFSKRKTKKRTLSKKALIISPQKSLPCLKTQLNALNEYEVVADWDAFNTADQSNKRVYLTSFETFNQDQIDDTLEGIILACPSKKTDFYFDLVKACKSRSFSLPLHILFAQGVEEITETIECLVHLQRN
jgi:hypothetical protein